MLLVVAFGLCMFVLSIIMIFSPDYWSDGIVKFSEKSYFHWFEIISRFVVGSIFLIIYESSGHPTLILSLGLILIGVSVGLVFLGQTQHRKFAVWSAKRFKPYFRLAGLFSLSFALFLIFFTKNFILG